MLSRTIKAQRRQCIYQGFHLGYASLCGIDQVKRREFASAQSLDCLSRGQMD